MLNKKKQTATVLVIHVSSSHIFTKSFFLIYFFFTDLSCLLC